jgi:hypothetical protein
MRIRGQVIGWMLSVALLMGSDPANAAPIGAAASPAGDATGTQAHRIADCLQRFGVNTFSKLNRNGYPWSWGGSKGEYDAATTARAINYLTGDSGLTIQVREYHSGDGSTNDHLTPLQTGWIRQVFQATGSPFSIAIGANGKTNAIGGMVKIVQDSERSGLHYVRWVEGINEPNMDFGAGKVTPAATVAMQTQLFQQVHAATPAVSVVGPSIVFGLPNPAAYLTKYLGATTNAILAHSDLNNVHFYPGWSPNGTYAHSRAGEFADIDNGFKQALPGKQAVCTEWHTTLFSRIHKTNDVYDAYWAPIFLLSSYLDYDWQGAFWFALFNYGGPHPYCGLFATNDASPYAQANTLRTLFQLTGDHGADKCSFTPGKLAVTVAGLPAAPPNAPHAGGRWALFQNSTGTYFLMLWNEQDDISPATVPVTVTFPAHAMAKVEEFNITAANPAALQTQRNTRKLTVNLDTSLRLLRITY